MKSSVLTQTKSVLTKSLTPALLAAVILSLGAGSSAWAGEGNRGNPGILPPQSNPFGRSYPEWVAAFWKWNLEYPLEGHPAVEHPTFDLSVRQSGQVWFWAAPDLGERSCTLPAGKALFLTLRDVECSSLEAEDSGFHGDTEVEQRDCAKFWADHIVNVFCTIDGVAVENLQAYRFASPQFQFTAPTPWIFGNPENNVGGTGTSVGDGYFLMLAPMRKGEHTVHYGGTFHFSVAEGDDFDGDFVKDITIHLTVAGD